MKIEKVVLKPLPPPKEFILTLSEDEARLLINIMGSIYGDIPERVFAGNLYDQLNKAGVVHDVGQLESVCLQPRAK